MSEERWQDPAARRASESFDADAESLRVRKKTHDPDGKERVLRYMVSICQPCIELQEQECHTPGCVFWMCDMGEVSEYLNRLMIRPIIDGKQIDPIQKGRV